MKVESFDKVPINYRVSGAGSPALVFVHGWCCNQSYWDAQVPYFSKDHTVVTLDLGGHGNSGLNREKWTVEAFGTDVKVVVDQLNLDQVILVGHSMGGSVIVEAARQMTDRIIALVGVDTFTNVGNQIPQDQVNQILAKFELNFAETMRSLVRNSMFSPDSDADLTDKIVNDMASIPPKVGLGSVEANIKYDPGASLEEIQIPIYSINRETSQLNVEAVKQHAPSFKATFMSGVGHFVMMEQPETFNRLLNNIIKELIS